jgi:hypothetical protein
LQVTNNMPEMVGTILPSPCILLRDASLLIHTGDGSAAGGGAVTATITPLPSSSVLGREMPDRRVRKADKFGWYICRSLVGQKCHYVLRAFNFCQAIHKNCLHLPIISLLLNLWNINLISCATSTRLINLYI